MKKIYILADSYNREIFMTKYDTHEEAFQAMKNELDNVLGFDSMNNDEAAASGYERGFDYDICDLSAWANAKHSDNDWYIQCFEV